MKQVLSNRKYLLVGALNYLLNECVVTSSHSNIWINQVFCWLRSPCGWQDQDIKHYSIISYGSNSVSTCENVDNIKSLPCCHVVIMPSTHRWSLRLKTWSYEGCKVLILRIFPSHKVNWMVNMSQTATTSQHRNLCFIIISRISNSMWLLDMRFH